MRLRRVVWADPSGRSLTLVLGRLSLTLLARPVFGPCILYRDHRTIIVRLGYLVVVWL